MSSTYFDKNIYFMPETGMLFKILDKREELDSYIILALNSTPDSIKGDISLMPRRVFEERAQKVTRVGDATFALPRNFSVEGVIKKRGGKDGKVIKNAVFNGQGALIEENKEVEIECTCNYDHDFTMDEHASDCAKNTNNLS